MSYSSIPKQLFACQIWETNYSADVNIFQKWIIKFGYNGKTHDLKEKHENMLGGKGGFFLLEICDNNNLNWKCPECQLLKLILIHLKDTENCLWDHLIHHKKGHFKLYVPIKFSL